MDLAFSPDGKTLATVSLDNTGALWDVPSGTRRSQLTSHTLAVFRLAFSPDSQTLVTCGLDEALRFWHVQTGRELMVVEKPLMLLPQFAGVRFSPDGSLMAAGLLSPARIQFFRAPSFAEIDAVEASNTGRQ